jgi:RNA polymerase sigma factor (TIGR02999 family)
MADVTQLLNAIGQGDQQASADLLPLLYEELRKLAAHKLSLEKPGQTLQATALVHEAYLRLLGPTESGPAWNSRGHFFAAAAEAMRRILVDQARRNNRVRHGGELRRVDFDSELQISDEADENLLALDEALERLVNEDSESAKVVKLRYFAGLTIEETASALGISVQSVNRRWAYARSWLFRQLR